MPRSAPAGRARGAPSSLCGSLEPVQRFRCRPHNEPKRGRGRAAPAPLLLAVALLTGCHHSSLPTTGDGIGPPPPSSSLGLTAGTYILELTGYAFSLDPEIGICQPFGVPRSGTNLVTTTEVKLEDGEWVARSASTGPTEMDGLELRLRDAGHRNPGGEALTGLVTGSAVDQGLFRPVRDVRVSIRGAGGSSGAELSGTTSAGPFLLGRVTGAIDFSDSTGATSTCPTVSWTLQRRPGQ